jgi:RNA polymerase sigma-70 factor (ECF subfamily)
MSLLRSRYRRKRFAGPQESALVLGSTADSGGGPAADLDRREIARAVYDALDRIDPRRRAVFVLVDVDGGSMEEASKALGWPIGTVKSRLFRARRDLAKLLEDYINE